MDYKSLYVNLYFYNSQLESRSKLLFCLKKNNCIGEDGRRKIYVCSKFSRRSFSKETRLYFYRPVPIIKRSISNHREWNLKRARIKMNRRNTTSRVTPSVINSEWPNGWGQLSYKYRGEKVGAVWDAPRLFMMVVRNANKRSHPVLTEVGNFREVLRVSTKCNLA